MKQPVIEFKHVSKSFRTWHERPTSLKTLLVQMMKFQLRLGHQQNKTVLNDISLSINKGDFVGIMGRNGAGKSTMLKLISNIYRPSKGTIVSYGRIAPLLELGAGFATELNGYENIYLNASILGFGKAEIESKVEQIVAFSELGPALENPVRNYSSGMLVRLGFSIAAHLDAEILLFDEILAVGDVGFQIKCLKKIEELHNSGKTIVLVTHSPEQVEKYCNRCIVFEQTGVSYDGNPETGTAMYRGLFSSQ